VPRDLYFILFQENEHRMSNIEINICNTKTLAQFAALGTESCDDFAIKNHRTHNKVCSLSILLALKGPGAYEFMASKYQLSQLQNDFLSSCHNRFTCLMIDNASSPGRGRIKHGIKHGKGYAI